MRFDVLNIALRGVYLLYFGTSDAEYRVAVAVTFHGG